MVRQIPMRKHFTSPRRQRVRFVVVHHSTILGRGDGRANEIMHDIWDDRPASAHYGVDGGHEAQFVRDGDAAWATGNTDGNHAGISIEHHNSTRGPSWRISRKTRLTGARRAAILHIRHSLGRPVSTNGGAGGTLRKHKSFTSTACPGPYLDKIWGRYVKDAQRAYDRMVKGKSPGRRPLGTLRVVTAQDGLNVRTGPSTSSRIVKTLRPGQRFRVLRRDPKHPDWYVTLRGRRVHSSADYSRRA